MPGLTAHAFCFALYQRIPPGRIPVFRLPDRQARQRRARCIPHSPAVKQKKDAFPGRIAPFSVPKYNAASDRKQGGWSCTKQERPVRLQRPDLRGDPRHVQTPCLVPSQRLSPSPLAMLTIKSWTFVTIPCAARLPRSASLLTVNSAISTQ